jgi:hypothetical protein
MRLLLAQQEVYDQRKFDQRKWEVGDWRTQKTRRIGEHLGVTALTFLEGDRRRVEREVVPALSIYRAQLVNLHGFPANKYGEVEQKLSNDNSVGRELLYVTSRIAHYVLGAEQGHNDERTREARVGDAVAHLHLAAESLAHIHGVASIEEAHFARLQELMGEDAAMLGQI